MRSPARFAVFPLLATLALSLCASYVDAATGLQPPVKLRWHYYKLNTSCHYAEEFVRHQVELFWKQDKSISAKLLRLLYSDCFVTGCDASILLDGEDSEKKADQNKGLSGFVVIDKIKEVMEARCPEVVSCSDILNLAARDAAHLAGAPAYPVFTGRRDGMSSSKASVDLPSPSISWEEASAYFESKGLDVLDMGVLLGSHGIGRTNCSNIEDRLYNFNNTGKPDRTMNKSFLDQMRKLCPKKKKGQPGHLVFLNPDSGSSYRFSESFYKRVLVKKSVLGVDQQLLYNNDTKEMTQEFAGSFENWRRSFALSMSRMGNINVLTGNTGQIRRNCRVVNK